MIYKIKNPYKEAHILDLNMMHVGEYRQSGVGSGEVLLTMIPLVGIAIISLICFMPELRFLAECQNIPGGDICTISIK